MAYLLRVVLPDRPGMLGAVATALGGVEADILSVDVVDRTPGHAVDDMVIELPNGRLADSLITAAMSIAGVRVESIRPYAGQLDTHRELELIDSITVDPTKAAQSLADGVPRIFRAGWALVVTGPSAEAMAANPMPEDAPMAEVIGASSAAPEIGEIVAPWWPISHPQILDVSETWAPMDWDRLGTELAAVPFGQNALLVGRPGGLGWRAGELARLSHIASIAASIS
jgi:hypothetical protein